MSSDSASNMAAPLLHAAPPVLTPAFTPAPTPSPAPTAASTPTAALVPASASSAAPISSFSRRTFGGERPQDVLAHVPDVPLALRDLIQRCWVEEQGARPSAEEAVAVLERIVEA
ncbi:hypothetical protein EON66_10260 [archaeon]|nr:MAG: hypothetical protein EON66_10260 [archaeon]